jgi:DNA-binding protein H-NS
VIEQIRQLMVEYDLTAEDIAPKRRRGRPGSTGGAEDFGAAPEVSRPQDRQDLVGPWPRPGMAGQAPRALPDRTGLIGAVGVTVLTPGARA